MKFVPTEIHGPSFKLIPEKLVSKRKIVLSRDVFIVNIIINFVRSRRSKYIKEKYHDSGNTIMNQSPNMKFDKHEVLVN